MSKRILLITVLTITCMLSGSSGLVMAADNSSNDIATEEAIGLYEKMLNADNAEKYYKQLSLAEQKAVNSIATNLKYETVTTTDDTKDETVGVTVTCNARDVLNNIVWSFNQRIQWSYNGTYITGIQDHSSWGTTMWPWGYAGLVSDPTESGGVGQQTFTRFSQGRFEYPSWTPVYVDEPYISQTVDKDGISEQETGGY